MIEKIVLILVIYAGMAVILGFTRKYMRRRLAGILGLIFTLQPVAMATYRNANLWVVLVFVVAGVFLLLFSTGETGRRGGTPPGESSRQGE